MILQSKLALGKMLIVYTETLDNLSKLSRFTELWLRKMAPDILLSRACFGISYKSCLGSFFNAMVGVFMNETKIVAC